MFNDASFKDLVDEARNNHYSTQLTLLFLDNSQQSLTRVTARMIQQNGLCISGGNVKINFSESFINAATYFIYFDRADFIYTGVTNKNQQITSFSKARLTGYHQIIYNIRNGLLNMLTGQGRISENNFNKINQNKDLSAAF